MPSKIIGLDLRDGSIGWTIRNTELSNNQFVKSGVSIFEKKGQVEGFGTIPIAKKRAEYRRRRKNYQADKYRKYAVLKILIHQGMCPLSMEELHRWHHYSKTSSRIYPHNQLFINWIRFDFDNDGKPDFYLLGGNQHESYYLFREKAIDPFFIEIFQSNPMILGRIFYHLVQHRGFKGRDDIEINKVMYGSPHDGIRGRNAIESWIKKYLTLGSALYHFQKETGLRIRKQYFLRKDIESEIRRICEVQNLDSELSKDILRTITYRRPYHNPQKKIGKCIFNKKKKRAPIGHPIYEEYCIWKAICSLKIYPPLGVSLDKYLSCRIYPLFIEHHLNIPIGVVKKRLAQDGAKMLAKYDDEYLICGSNILHLFQTLFGTDWKKKLLWDSLFHRDAQISKRGEKYYDAQDLWHILNMADDRSYLYSFAIDKLRLSNENAVKFSKFIPAYGYSNLSLSVIKQILPYLMKGYRHSIALYMANMDKVFGNKLAPSMCDEVIDIIRNVEDKQRKECEIHQIMNRVLFEDYGKKHLYEVEKRLELNNTEQDIIDLAVKQYYGDRWMLMSILERVDIVNTVRTRYLLSLNPSVKNRVRTACNTVDTYKLVFEVLSKKYHIHQDRISYLWHYPDKQNNINSDIYHGCMVNSIEHTLSSNKLNCNEEHYSDRVKGIRHIRLLRMPQSYFSDCNNQGLLKVIHELRRLLNYLLQTEQIDEDTKIVLHISSDLQSQNKMRGYGAYISEQNKVTERIKKKVCEINEECNKLYNENDQSLLNRLRLWEEQNYICPYSGNVIGLYNVFNGINYHISNIIPLVLTVDNGLRNLVLADRRFECEIKKNNLPIELENYNVSTNGYSAILPRLDYLIDKKKHFEYKYTSWRTRAFYAESREQKNLCLVNAYKAQKYYEYYSYKYNAFVKERYNYVPGNFSFVGKNDLLPIKRILRSYLSSVFNKISFEDTILVDIFRRIYSINNEESLNNSSYAVKSSILTLIPDYQSKSKILYNYFQLQSNGVKYNTQPVDWLKFKPHFVWELKKSVLVNYIKRNRIYLTTRKIICKKKNGKRNIFIATGDTIRGQLHDESFYGVIKEPVRDSNQQILFDTEGRMKLNNKMKIVIRRDLKFQAGHSSFGFKNLTELEEQIVDKDLFQMIKKQVEQSDFKTALSEGVFMLDSYGNRVNKIRHIRCYANFRGCESLVKVHRHTSCSLHNYKQYALAKNGGNPMCLFYRCGAKKTMRVLSIMELAQLDIKCDNYFFKEPEFSIFKSGNTIYHLHAVLHIGMKFLFYQQSKEEVYDILDDVKKLSERLFILTQFEIDGRMKFKHHLLMDDGNNCKEYSVFQLSDHPQKLRLTKNSFNFLIERKDFCMNIDGTIRLK